MVIMGMRTMSDISVCVTSLTSLERIYCPAVSGFEVTPSNTDVNIFCGEHYHGNMTATCSAVGAWTNVDVSDCVAIPTCEEEGIWPRTNINSVRELSCGEGILGTKTRACNADGTWGQADESQCGMSIKPSYLD